MYNYIYFYILVIFIIIYSLNNITLYNINLKVNNNINFKETILYIFRKIIKKDSSFLNFFYIPSKYLIIASKVLYTYYN